MNRNIVILLLLIIIPFSSKANSLLESLSIGDKEPINKPIAAFNISSNSYPDPFSEDEIIFSITHKNYLDFSLNLLTKGQIEMFKKYPHTLDIKIERTEFLAKINNNGKIFLIGSNGKLSDVKFSDKELPFIFGKPTIDEFIEFTNTIENSKFSLGEIKNLYFFPSKRWDLELKNSIILKLSKEHTKLSLDQAFEFLNDNSFKAIEVVDARIKNQIILNE